MKLSKAVWASDVISATSTATLVQLILVVVTTAVLRGTLIASAQVSSGSPEAAQQNLAKTTDNPGQNDQQNVTTNPRQELPRRRLPSLAGDEAGGVHIRSGPHAVR
jgi:hypothetical protein